MNELIHITTQAIGDDAIPTVNARELHAFLEVGKDFSTWLKDRTEQYGFKENSDFVCSPNLGSDGRGGHNRKDYHLSLDMAKELAMVERNEKGKQARQYFIECERKAKNPALSLTRMDLIKMALDSEQRALELEAEKLMLSADKAALEHQAKRDAPKVEFHDHVVVAPGALSLAEAAKILGTGRSRFTAQLRQMGWLRRNNEPYQDKIEAGLLDVKLGTWDHPDFGIQRSVTALVTGKGLARLQSMLKPLNHIAPARAEFRQQSH